MVQTINNLQWTTYCHFKMYFCFMVLIYYLLFLNIGVYIYIYLIDYKKAILKFKIFY